MSEVIKFKYPTTAQVCSQAIELEIDGDTVKRIAFVGGCPGNTSGVAKLGRNRKVDELITLLSGVRCGNKATSCPDQLAQALKLYKNKYLAHK